jgi:uncharacterized membrane protein
MFWSPSVHSIINFIHIFYGVFWLAWIVFIFLIMRPVAGRVAGMDVMAFMVPVRRRVRGFVLWLIPVIILTGVYNMAYRGRGLLHGRVLTGAAVGHRMIWKLVAAAILFSIYYFAPRILGKKMMHGKDASPRVKPNSKAKKAEIILHIIAFSAGCAAAYLGVTIAG